MQLTIRNVSPEVQFALTARAKARRQSLNAFLLDLLEREAETPDVNEILDRALARPRFGVTTDQIVDIIREVRGEV